jgi:DNA-binding transcriptional LysR family regulator
MDRLDVMSVVLAVAEAGSLSAAARQHKTPLATVSRKVSELEAHLRTKLFNRTSRTLIPTDAGRAFIAASKRILADLAEAERAASGEYTTPRGELIVSAPNALGRTYLQPIVTEFLAMYPDVDVHIHLSDRAVNLLEDHVDVALRIGNLADSSLIAMRVGEICRVACASPGYLKSRGTPKSPEELAEHHCITYQPLQGPGMWTFKRDQKEYVVPVRSRLVVSNLESAVDAALSGLGITIALSYLVADYVKSGQLTPLLQGFQPPSMQVSLVYPPNPYMAVKLRAFLDFAVPRLRTRFGQLPKDIAPGRASARTPARTKAK